MNQMVKNPFIVALRNEKGSYNRPATKGVNMIIVALRNEKGSYNGWFSRRFGFHIVALRNEKGSYNHSRHYIPHQSDCSTAK